MMQAVVFDCFGVLCDQHGQRNEPVIDFVRTVRKKYRTALLSNVRRDFIDATFQKNELSELFNAVVISSEAGVGKPSPLAYEKVAMQLGVLPEECVMVDDSQINISGAQQAGMHGIYYKTLEACQKDLAEILGESHA